MRYHLKVFSGKVVTVLSLLLSVQLAHAEAIAVPLKIDFLQLRQLVVIQLVDNEFDLAELLNDPHGCNQIRLSDPKFSEINRHFQIKARLSAKFAVKFMNQCQPLLAWEGYIQIISNPVISPSNPHHIHLKMIDGELINLNNEHLTSGVLWDQVRKLIRPLFDQFRLDLTPSIKELGNILPSFFPKHTQVQLNEMLTSVRLTQIQVFADGIHSKLVFDIAKIPEPRQPVQVLTQQEQLQWQKKWQSMDALLTHTVKYYAMLTKMDDLKQTLFDLLIDARHRLQDVLQQDQADDPVRHWFIDSWTQLISVLRHISEENPKFVTLAFIATVTATDVLHALDELSPTYGLDISIDGLRRLSRMINNNDIDSLKYDEAVDQELRRLFQFQIYPEKDVHSSFTLKFWPIHSALTGNERQLDSWVPALHEVDIYLSKVSGLLQNSATQTLAESTLTEQQQGVFRKLLLATAWQESCWRQYAVIKDKTVPFSSSNGDIGIMQINEKVWRGFVDLHQLRWDIDYNISVGSSILLNYMLRHAIANAEDEQYGGIDNLARATYSAYNGGPGKASRYRSDQVLEAHRKIDAAFYEKYLKVKQGQEMAEAQCLSGYKKIKADLLQPEKQIASIVKNYIHDEAWVEQQDKNHFTLQLGIFNSRQSAKNFIRRQGIKGKYAVYQQREKGQLRYGVIYGSFQTRQSAENESIRFKQMKPWARLFGTIILSQ